MKKFRRIIITGTPGTGKTVIGSMLAKELDIPFTEANKVVKEKGLWKKRPPEVNIARLRKALLSKWGIIEGHLLCEFALPQSVAIVLRCHPSVLAKRLMKRNYSAKKLDANLVAEAIDYCALRAQQEYGTAIEVDCTRANIKACVKRCLAALSLKKRKCRVPKENPDFSSWLLGHKL
ncbi:AAA family ATPase [archaeon]|nr:AAA family ATPase [archaeon]